MSWYQLDLQNRVGIHPADTEVATVAAQPGAMAVMAQPLASKGLARGCARPLGKS